MNALLTLTISLERHRLEDKKHRGKQICMIVIKDRSITCLCERDRSCAAVLHVMFLFYIIQCISDRCEYALYLGVIQNVFTHFL